MEQPRGRRAKVAGDSPRSRSLSGVAGRLTPAADLQDAKMSIRILEPHNSRCNASDRGYPHHVQCVRIGDVPVTPQIMDIVIPPGD